MRTEIPVAVRRIDYAPSAWRIPAVSMHVELSPDATRVTTTLNLERRVPDGVASDDPVSGRRAPLVLDGTDFVLESIHLDERALGDGDYRRTDTTLTLAELPDACTLVVVTVLDPSANTALEGLYRSNGVYCTQCEAEGFRRITYALDRPDVLSVFDVAIEAPRVDCPVLLSNGNLVAEEDLGDGRRLARWHDPHPKPVYLFALVAGDLASIEDRFVTRSGRTVTLHVYTEAHNVDKCDFAMASLKAAMRWDEEAYGFEYDLERFSIVAVDDFNMGAMENKGLNVFNTKYVLADAESATDADFMGIESVVAHEYFHNWTGNRITCRDWFQLSLKEGLTVFRDQSFTADRRSATVKRIEDVRLLRARQFPEDAGPMAHPIRPDSYIEINNFYTVTVYEKGAEVIRMLYTLLGDAGWQAGMALYVERHDGEAATCDDFVDAMETASGADLARFRRWYSTAGTPVLSVSGTHDAGTARYTLTVRQRVPDTPGQADKAPLHLPLRMGLLDPDGAPVPITLGRPDARGGTLLDVREREERFVFENVVHPPIPSLLRGFSAPVRLEQALAEDELAVLAARDVDPFNRWEAGQRLATLAIARVEAGGEVGETVIATVGAVLADESLDPAYRAEMLALPSFDTLAEARERVDVAALDAARRTVLAALAIRWREPLERLAARPSCKSDPSDGRAMGERALENAALALLGALAPAVVEPMAERRYRSAANMTDRIAALRLLCHGDGPARARALADFHATWRENRLVIDKWFAVQAAADRDSVVENVQALAAHPDFSLTNPNRARSLLSSLAYANPVHFHRADGAGHRLLAERVRQLDRSNPQLAASLVAPLGRWARFAEPQSGSMRDALVRLRDAGPLSPDVFEIVSRSLDVGPAS